MQTKVENIVKIPSHFLFYDLKLTGIDTETLLTNMSPENQVQFWPEDKLAPQISSKLAISCFLSAFCM